MASASSSSLFLASPISTAPRTRTQATPFPLFPARPSLRLRQQPPAVAAALQAEHQPAVAAAPKPPAVPFRVGHGFDLHRLEPGLPLIIGGISIPHDRGCDTHSDCQSEIEMDSEKGRSEMQMDAGPISKDPAAGKGKTRQERKRKKKAPATRKKAEEPSVRKRDSKVKPTRRPAPVYKQTIPVDEDNLGAFRELWMRNWGDEIDSMEQETTVPSVRSTDDVSPEAPASAISTLQFFEVKIESKEPFGLKWPLRVYGFIAARDFVDFKRNIIFERKRDDYQLIFEEFPYLLLTGPKRAVVLIDPVYFEVDLKVQGTGQSEDQDLICLAEPFDDSGPLDSSLFKCVYTGKISKLELTFGHIVRSVEAAISMKVISGSWPAGFQGFFAAKTASINDKEILLLVTCHDEELPIADDGMIKLQRHVVCAEILEGEDLEVYVNAQDADMTCLGDGLIFKPQENSYLCGTLNVGSCEIEVTVTWSLISW